MHNREMVTKWIKNLASSLFVSFVYHLQNLASSLFVSFVYHFKDVPP